jgi:hypothetical protein
VAYDLLFGDENPKRLRKKGKKKMARKRKRGRRRSKGSATSHKRRKGRRRKSNPSGRRRRGRRKGRKGRRRSNPFGLRTSGVTGLISKGVALGLGAVVSDAVGQNVAGFIPASLGQSAVGRAVINAGIAIGAGWVAGKVGPLKPYAEHIRNGGLALAAYRLVAPTALPMLKFVGAPALPATDAGAGDAFILSRGGISTMDRMPRDTAALAGVGDAYVKTPGGAAGMSPGVSGAPNGIAPPWSASIYGRR